MKVSENKSKAVCTNGRVKMISCKIRKVILNIQRGVNTLGTWGRETRGFETVSEGVNDVRRIIGMFEYAAYTSFVIVGRF